jgi:bacterial/archaeal transporter family protein
MNWLFFAILSPAIYALVNFVDKHLVSNEIKDYKAMPIYTSVVAFFAGTLFWILTGFPLLGAKDGAIVILTGMIAAWSLFLYFKALADEETTTIIILFQTLPIMSLIFAYIFLGETITPKQFLGFVLIISAAIGITFKPKTKGEKILSKAFFLILLYNILWALSGVLIKFAINANSFSKILSYESWGIALGGTLVFLLFPGIRKAFLVNIKTIRRRTVNIIIVNEGLFVLAKSLGFYAFSLGPVALVSVLTSTQVFFGILYGFILTKSFPKLFKEDISSEGLTKKIGLSILVVLGIILLV